MPLAVAQYTIRDENDISMGATPPPTPVNNQLWLDTSVSPSILKRWTGSSWDIVNQNISEINNFSRSGNLDRWTAPYCTIKPSTAVGNYIDCNTNGNAMIISDLFEVDPNKSYKLSLMVQVPCISGTGTWYFGVYAYDKDKNRIGTYLNNGTTLDTNTYFNYETKPNQNLNWRTFDGYLYSNTTPVDANSYKGNCRNFMKLASNTKYLSIRCLNYRVSPGYGDDTFGSIYFAHPTITQIDGLIAPVETRLKNAEQKVTPEAIVGTVTASTTWTDMSNTVTATATTASEAKQTADSLTDRVTSVENNYQLNKKVGAFRYVRDWLNGSSANTGNHWVELEVWDGGVNIAKGIIPTGSATILNPAYLTDGVISTSLRTDIQTVGWQYVQIDLGAVKYDVDMIKTYHYYEDLRRYNHKLQVSIDGTNWVELYNSDVSGAYAEDSRGRTYIINESYMESRLKSAELQITPSAIKATVSDEYLNKADASATYASKSTVTQTADSIRMDFNSRTARNSFTSGNPPQILEGGGSAALENWNWGYSAYQGTGKAYRWNFTGTAGSIRFRNVIQKNGTFSVSFWARSLSGNSPAFKIDLCDRGHWNTIAVNTEWKLVMFENIAVDNYTAEVYNFLDIRITYSQSLYFDCLISNIMVNEGPVCAPWSEPGNEIRNGSTQIDSNGVTIYDGALKVSNSNGDTVIDGSKYLHYIEAYGNGAIVIDNGQVSKVVTIPHNLGFQPDFKGEWLNTAGVVFSDPWVEYDWSANNTYHGPSTVCRMSADKNNLYIHAQRRAANQNGGTLTFYYRYFILGGVKY